MAHDYGKCHVCGEEVREQIIDQTVRAGSDWLLIRSVPTGVCSKCGEQILQWSVLQRLEQLTNSRNSAKPIEKIEMPVFAF
jgi:YgiT-type zinc finger domain-containing protein